MKPDDILELAFGIPFFIILGAGAGIFVCAMFGVDITSIFKKDGEDK